MTTLSGIGKPHSSAIVPGAGTATDIRVPGLSSGDSVIAARHINASLGTNADVSAEVSITDDETIQLSTTTTTGDYVFIAWLEG